jgi:hypothetical protein
MLCGGRGEAVPGFSEGDFGQTGPAVRGEVQQLSCAFGDLVAVFGSDLVPSRLCIRPYSSIAGDVCVSVAVGGG